MFPLAPDLYYSISELKLKVAQSKPMLVEFTCSMEPHWLKELNVVNFGSNEKKCGQGNQNFQIQNSRLKAPGEEGEVALMDDHKREPREGVEGVVMDMQNKCARGRGQGYGIEWEYAKGSASVEMGVKGCESGEKRGGYEIFCALVHEKEVTNGGIKAQVMNATVKVRV